MLEKFQCKSKRVISIGEEQVGSNLFLTIDFALNDTLVNLNAVQYSDSFLIDIADNSENYAGLPLKVDLKKLISGNTDNLTHNYSPNTGRFYNQMIGSFVKFYTQENGDGLLELCGQVRIPKEFDQACEVIQELYNNSALFVSYEIVVGNYTTINNGEVKYVDKDPENYLAAYSIVSQPAVVSAKALALVAEIIKKGGEPLMPKDKEYTKEQFIADFNKNLKIKELAELSYDQVLSQLWSQLKTALGDDYWNFYTEDNGVDFLIMKNYSDGSLIRIDFSVDGDTVVILDAYPVTRSYDPINSNENNEEDGNMTLEEAKAKIEAAEAKLKTKETELAAKEKELEEKNKEIAGVSEKLTVKETELSEKVKQTETLSASVLEKENKIKELEPIQEKYNTLVAEKTAKENEIKKTELAEKYGKLLPKEVLAEVEMAEALNKLDEAKLSAKVVEIALETASKRKPTIQTASRITDDIKIGGGQDILSKYVTISGN